MRKKIKASAIFSVICFLLFCGFSYKACTSLYKTYSVNKTNLMLKNMKPLILPTVSESTPEWNHPLLRENEDYVGWLTVYGTNADGPVVQGADNDEYLRKDFYGEKSVPGTFFMDEKVDVLEENGNRIIYGHMMHDGTMFGTFKKYKDGEFFKRNNIIRWEDRFGESFYRIFAAVLVSGSATNTEYMNIQQWAHHLDEEETQLMLREIEDRSYIFTKDENRGEGQYIFLVTCEYSQYQGKLVLVGERIERTGEKLE